MSPAGVRGAAQPAGATAEECWASQGSCTAAGTAICAVVPAGAWTRTECEDSLGVCDQGGHTTRAACEASAGGTGAPRKRWAAFISHYKGEAAMEARFLQTELEALLGRKCFLDSDDLRDLRLLQQAVRESDCLILVQSKSVLFRPYCILEMVTAIEARVPIVGVSLSVAGIDMYNFNLPRPSSRTSSGPSSKQTRAPRPS